MPRPSLTDEIMALARDFASAVMMEHATGLTVWSAEAATARKELRARLGALETEVAERRRDSARLDWLERQYVEVRSPTRFGSWLAFNANVATSDEEGEWWDVPSDIRAKIDAKRERHPSPSALPCTSEYVNAQTGYDREDGG